MLMRQAQLTDAMDMARLTSQLGYEVDEADVARQLERILKDDDHALFVAEVEDQELAGWVHAHGRHLLEAPSFAEIGGLVVDNRQRRRGIGEKLMRKCEEWAERKGYREVRLRSAGHRKDAHEFYKKIGYANVKWQQVFSMPLDR
ncbi:MAG TPA: GNAT family N-acetyltransferase [Bacillales bacterium]|nr:GNAT family N-acetyltransferase [Bacillales bacterium]